LHWAAKDWAVRHWAAKDQLVLLLIHRAAAPGNLHWVCSWFATAESDQYKMKPQEFLDLDMFRQSLQGQEGHQVDAANHRYFAGGTNTQKMATVNELLFKAECCSNCGIPMKAVP
jgi:hypothetical protein